MPNDNLDDIIPGQEKGAKTDTEHSVTANDLNQAIEIFVMAKERLQDVNNWHTWCGAASAHFQLTDEAGNAVSRFAEKGDHFRINIPAPGNSDGRGYDWVRIEEIENKTNSSSASGAEFFAIKVRPAPDPKTIENDTAHFFKSDATSTFAVERHEKKVTASVHGRNETPNIDQTEGILDKARNALIALGAMAGLSSPQWKSLVKGLLEK